MKKRLSWRVKEWIISIVCSYVKIGGRCGICGKWEQDCLTPSYWRVTICKECVETAEE